MSGMLKTVAIVGALALGGGALIGAVPALSSMAVGSTTLGSIAGTVSSTVGTVAPAALALGGTMYSAQAQAEAGQIQAQQDLANAEMTAQQYERQGVQARAEASMKAMEESRRRRLVMSRAQAVGAASGGGVDYEGLAELDAEGRYRTQMAIWEGDEIAAERGYAARVTRAGGRYRADAARATGRINRDTTLLAGGASLFEKYG